MLGETDSKSTSFKCDGNRETKNQESHALYSMRNHKRSEISKRNKDYDGGRSECINK